MVKDAEIMPESIDNFLENNRKHDQQKLNIKQKKLLNSLKIKFEKRYQDEKKFNFKKFIKKFLFEKNVITNYDSRNRFNHRYNINDEIIWYKKFDKMYLKDI